MIISKFKTKYFNFLDEADRLSESEYSEDLFYIFAKFSFLNL